MTVKSNEHIPFLIGTYNILNPFHAVKWNTIEGLNKAGKDNWEEGRREAILQNITTAQLSICALQEISERTHPELVVTTSSGQQMKCTKLWKHFTEEPEGAHGVTVLYDSERFSVVSDIGIKTTQEQYRYGTQVDLKDHLSGYTYRVISVHLKGYDPYETDLSKKEESQIRGDQELREYVAAFSQNLDGIDGIFVLGDFNEDTEEFIRRGPESRQGYLMEHGFKWTGVAHPTEVRSGRQIDWIFYRDLHEDIYKIKEIGIQQDLSASDHSLTVVKHVCSLNALAQVII